MVVILRLHLTKGYLTRDKSVLLEMYFGCFLSGIWLTNADCSISNKIEYIFLSVTVTARMKFKCNKLPIIANKSDIMRNALNLI